MLYQFIKGLIEKLEIKKKKLNYDDEWLNVVFKDMLKLRIRPEEVVL